MRVLIADDEPLARSLLRALLEDSRSIEVLGEVGSGDETLALAERLRPDAVFLDIDMPRGTGILVATELRERCDAEIVFVTAHELHAVDAFELGATDYLLKPVRRARLAKALERVRARRGDRRSAAEANGSRALPDSAFWVQTREGKLRVPFSEIVWIEAARDHVYLHATKNRSYLHRITMGELEEKMRSTDMIRVQRSAFVRLNKIAAVLRRGKTMLVELEDSTRIPVGPNYREKALTLLGNS